MKITPKGHILSSFANRGGMGWKKALYEWIDNALAADATTIEIEISKAFARIKDNGKGTATVHAFATLGEHIEHSKPDGISCYGVGCKDAALWIGKESSTMTVTSVHRGTARQIVVNWLDASRNDWSIDEPDERGAREGERGTEIIVKPVGAGLPTKTALERMLADIGYFYAPALKRGVQISIKASVLGSAPRPATRWEPPPLEEGHIDTTINVNGRSARLFIGVVKEGHSTDRRGITYFRKFRVIEAAGPLGCGQYNHAHVCGFVELDQSWRLTTNKETIVGAADLYAAVEKAALPVLKKADERGSLLVSRHITSALSAGLNAGIANAKAKRRRKKREGTVSPTGTGRPHKQAENEQQGSTFPSRSGGDARANGVSVTFASLGGGKRPVIGQYKHPTVILNSDHPMIVSLSGNNANIPCMGAIAAALISVDASVEKQRSLPGLNDDEDATAVERFQKILGAILASETTLFDGESLTSLPEAAE